MRDRDLSKYPLFLRRILQNEDCLIGFFVMWFIGLTIFPTGAFYYGTIASSAHVHDLRIKDMHTGGWYALGGLGLGILLGLYGTFVYPKVKTKEAAAEEPFVYGHTADGETILKPTH